jgi:hypothetical protein
MALTPQGGFLTLRYLPQFVKGFAANLSGAAGDATSVAGSPVSAIGMVLVHTTRFMPAARSCLLPNRRISPRFGGREKAPFSLSCFPLFFLE